MFVAILNANLSFIPTINRKHEQEDHVRLSEAFDGLKRRLPASDANAVESSSETACLQKLLGFAREPSFYDILYINRLYSCDSRCAAEG